MDAPARVAFLKGEGCVRPQTELDRSWYWFYGRGTYDWQGLFQTYNIITLLVKRCLKGKLVLNDIINNCNKRNYQPTNFKKIKIS